MFVSTNNGKVELGGLSNFNEYQFREPTEVEKFLIEKVSEVIFTYNPG